jgi:hypothetical protein
VFVFNAKFSETGYEDVLAPFEVALDDLDESFHKVNGLFLSKPDLMNSRNDIILRHRHRASCKTQVHGMNLGWFQCQFEDELYQPCIY